MSAISKITENEIRNSLSSIVPQEEYISKKELLETVKNLVIGLLNFKAEEKEFLEKLLDNAEYAPSLLFGEYPELSVRLEKHPALLWKRLNVEKHLKKG